MYPLRLVTVVGVGAAVEVVEDEDVVDVGDVVVDVVVVTTAVPLSAYRSSLDGPPQYSVWLPAHIILHPFTFGSELVWLTEPAARLLPQ